MKRTEIMYDYPVNEEDNLHHIDQAKAQQEGVPGKRTVET